MSSARSIDPRQEIVGYLSDSPHAAARPSTHFNTPALAVSTAWNRDMANKRTEATRKRGPGTHNYVSPDTVWTYLKARFPAHTEKYVARELNVPHRTVEGWRYRLPSARHLLLLIQAWPAFVNFILATEDEDKAAIASMKAEIAEIETHIRDIEAQKNGKHFKPKE
jgi:hypothetical protein